MLCFNATPGKSHIVPQKTFPARTSCGGNTTAQRMLAELRRRGACLASTVMWCQSYLHYSFGSKVDLDILTRIAPDDWISADKLYTGWDPTIGFGTPDFEKMKKAALDVFGWHAVPQPMWDCPPAGGWGWKNEY